MSDWDIYSMDCDFCNETPSRIGFIKTELLILSDNFIASGGPMDEKEATCLRDKARDVGVPPHRWCSTSWAVVLLATS